MKNNLKHTPGPWLMKWDDENRNPRLYIKKEGYGKIAQIAQPLTAEQEANANLICTATEMLEALINLCDCFAPHISDPLFPIWKKACEVIKKAEGGIK